jgi:hypothetical protein
VTIATSEAADRQKPVNGRNGRSFVVGFLGCVGSRSRGGRARIGFRIQTLRIVFQYDTNPRALDATGAVSSQDSRTFIVQNMPGRRLVLPVDPLAAFRQRRRPERGSASVKQAVPTGLAAIRTQPRPLLTWLRPRPLHRRLPLSAVRNSLKPNVAVPPDRN